jgi:hypothetical protein
MSTSSDVSLSQHTCMFISAQLPLMKYILPGQADADVVPDKRRAGWASVAAKQQLGLGDVAGT